MVFILSLIDWVSLEVFERFMWPYSGRLSLCCLVGHTIECIGKLGVKDDGEKDRGKECSKHLVTIMTHHLEGATRKMNLFHIGTGVLL